MPVPEGEIGGAESKEVGDASIDEVLPSSGPSRGVPAPTSSAPKNDLLDLNDLLDSPAPAAQPTAPAVGGAGGDLLDLLGGGAPAAAPAAAPALGGGGDLGLLDIFGGGAAAPALAPAAPSAPHQMVAYDKAGLKIVLLCRKEPDGSATIMAKFGNSMDAPMTNFVFEAAVPKYIRLVMQPASGQVLPPHTDVVSQTMSVQNSTNGEKGLLMKLRIGYMLNGQQVQEMAQVGDFPTGY